MVRSSAIEKLQRMKCAEVGAEFMKTADTDILGVSEAVLQGLLPLNGLRHPPFGGTSGWYIWAGTTLSDSRDFFKPLHATHMRDLCPQVEPLLGLAPGWRFLIADDSEDVWFDSELQNSS